jgi:predicted permease
MSLLLARGVTRERELAIRFALGAGRIRLARQTLTESLLLALAAGLLGWVFAQFLVRLFIFLSPEGMPFLRSSRIDLRIIVFTFLLSLACSVLFGLAPALITPRLQALTSRTEATASRALLRQLLVIAQIAASTVLLIGGALLFRSFSNLQNQNLGFTGVSTVTAQISLGISAYGTQTQQMAFFKELERRLLYGPGITCVAVSDSLPPGGYHHEQIYASMTVDGKPKPIGGTGGLVAWRWVTPDYFHILGIPLVEGQGFNQEQLTSSQHFVILSSRLANRMFPRQDPISQHLRLASGDPDDPSYTVVGVARDVKNNGLSGADEPEYYRLRRDNPSDWGRYSHVIVKSSLPATETENWIRSQLAAQDPTIPVSIETFSERVTQMADQPRFETVLVASFAAAGLLLSLIGLYGVISFLVAQRSQEIGLRMALGATRKDILRLILASGLKLIIPGSLVGLFFALGLSRILASVLFNISPYDPVTIASVVLVLVIVAVAATLIPAHVAASIDPTAALRLE